MNIAARATVYAALDGERDYQERKWEGKPHEVAAYVTFMQHHMTRAIMEVTTQHGHAAALDQIRKVTALGVACMELHGVPNRE